MGGSFRPLLGLVVGLVAVAGSGAADDGFAPAVACYDACRWNDARGAFERLAAAHPGNAEALAYLADLADIRNDPTAALGYLQRAAAAAPNDAHVQNALGDAYGLLALKASFLSKLGLALKSRAAYERAVELEPANVRYRRSLMDYDRQAPEVAGGGLARAWSQAAAIERLDPQQGRLARASLCEAEGRFDAAFGWIERALGADPADYGALYELGNAAALSGRRIEDGIAALRRCLTLVVPPNQPEHASASWRMGCLLEMKGDRAGARSAYRAALALNPDFQPASEALGRI